MAAKTRKTEKYKPEGLDLVFYDRILHSPLVLGSRPGVWNFKQAYESRYPMKNSPFRKKGRFQMPNADYFWYTCRQDLEDIVKLGVPEYMIMGWKIDGTLDCVLSNPNRYADELVRAITNAKRTITRRKRRVQR